jgi:hypothetical protein
MQADRGNAARLECLDRLAGSKKYHLSADGPVPFDMAKKQAGPPF